MKTDPLILFERVTCARADKLLRLFANKSLNLHFLKDKKVSISNIDTLDVDKAFLGSGMENHDFRREVWEVRDVPDIEALHPVYRLLVDIDIYLIKLYRLQNLHLVEYDIVSRYKKKAVSYLDSIIGGMNNGKA